MGFSEPPARPLVLIATPTAKARRQWCQALETEYSVLTVADRGSLERSITDLRPAVLLLDFALHRLGGVEGVHALRQLSPSTKIVLFAKTPTAKEGIAVLKAGARGYYNKDLDPAILQKAVSMVMNGEVWVKRSLISSLIEEMSSLTRRLLDDSTGLKDSRLGSLTNREREVVLMIGNGASNKEIARRLKVTDHTVKAHLTAVFRKLDLPGRVQLALLASEYDRNPAEPVRSDDRSSGGP
jgi:two-component system NarL family response regulator